MQVNVSIITFLLLMAIMHFHNNNNVYADDENEVKFSCKEFCKNMNFPNLYQVEQKHEVVQRKKSCNQLTGNRQHSSCVKDCDSTFSLKRMACFMKCGVQGASCRESCNIDADTRVDMTNYNCVSDCNQDYKKRIQKYYKCVQKNPDKKCKLDGEVPEILDEYKCKSNWTECYHHSMMNYFTCRSKQVSNMCKTAAFISAVERDMNTHCSIMKKGSSKEKECRSDAFLYGYDTIFACEDLYAKTIIEKKQKCQC